MIRSIFSKITMKAIGAYAAAVAICLVTLAWVMKLWDADIGIPFYYAKGRDVLAISMLIKGLIDNGWYQHNIFLGMPTGQYMYDYPLSNDLDFLIIKLISIFAHNYATTMNLYFLLTFPLTTVAAMLVFRQFKVSYASSLVGSLLFAFIPYHMMRGEEHLFLAAYFFVPPMVMVILWLYTEGPFLFNSDKDKGKLRLDLLNHKSIVAIIICILVSFSSTYYAFFSCFFLIVAGITSMMSQKNKYVLLTSVILIIIIISGTLITLSPTFIFQHDNGKNLKAQTRSPAEAEIYGLKIDQLLMPVHGHRISFFADISDTYVRTAPLINENRTASLGIIGSAGFLILIAWFFFMSSRNLNSGLNDTIIKLNILSILNLSAILLSTIGGFGAIFAYLISPQVRCYNRASIFIALYSLFAIVILLDIFSQKYIKTKINRIFFLGLIGIILILGVLDQTSESFVPSYALAKEEYLNDETFIRSIEAVMPENAMIFQLPYVPFPEYPPINKMTDYSNFRGYLHSKDLRWSYGAMKGRSGDNWQRHVTSMPVIDMLKTLSQADFKGIYIDGYGFEDDGASLVSNITQILEIEPIVSDNRRLYFFDMKGYNLRIKANSSE